MYLNDTISFTYFCSHPDKDLLRDNRCCKYKCLHDCFLHNEHWQHSQGRVDVHTLHFLHIRKNQHNLSLLCNFQHLKGKSKSSYLEGKGTQHYAHLCTKLCQFKKQFFFHFHAKKFPYVRHELTCCGTTANIFRFSLAFLCLLGLMFGLGLLLE